MSKQPTPNTNVIPVNVNDIVAGNNDRITFSESELIGLAESIKNIGCKTEPTFRPIANGKYEIVAGERRTRAMRDILGYTVIYAKVEEMTDEEALEVMLSENTGRSDLNPIEEANAFQKRIDIGWSIEKIAKVAGYTIDTINKRLSLLGLRENIRHLVAYNNLPIGHALTMVRLDNNRQHIALQAFLKAKNSMPLVTFKEICDELYMQQCSEHTMFNMEELELKYVEVPYNTKRSGKGTVTGAPTNEDLPAVPAINGNATTATIIEAYILSLVESGHTNEAGAIGNLYNALVQQNFIKTPVKSSLVPESGV